MQSSHALSSKNFGQNLKKKIGDVFLYIFHIINSIWIIKSAEFARNALELLLNLCSEISITILL